MSKAKLRPAEQVAREMVRAELRGPRWVIVVGGNSVVSTDSYEAAHSARDVLVDAMARLIEQSRPDGAATEHARHGEQLREISAAVGEALDHLHQVSARSLYSPVNLARAALHRAAVALAGQRPTDIAGRILGLIRDRAVRWADSGDDGVLEAIRWLREAREEASRTGALSDAWTRTATLGGERWKHVREAADELEVIVRETAGEQRCGMAAWRCTGWPRWGFAEEDAVILSLDIETIRHPGVPPSDKDLAEDRCPAAPHHRIVAAAGVVLEERRDPFWCEATRAVTFGEGSIEEPVILEHLSRAFANEPRLLTYNGDGFDLRVIVAAAMEHGIQIPWLFSREVTYRYGSDGHEDVQDTLSSYKAARPGKQDAWARRCGLPGKMGVDGGDVAALVSAGRLEELRAYNGQDAAQLAGIWLRKEFVSGRLSLEGYRMSAQSLVVLFERTPGLRAIVEHERFNRQRFLLET